MTIKKSLSKVWTALKSKDKPVFQVSPETKAKVRKAFETYQNITGPAPTADKFLNDDPLGYKQLFGQPETPSESVQSPPQQQPQPRQPEKKEPSLIEREVYDMFSGMDADSILDGFQGYESKRKRTRR